MKKIFVSLLLILIMQNALAVLYTNDISNGCINSVIHPYNNNAEMTARWTPNTHTCNVNEFLPANTDACVACPMGQTCTGGTFDFNETETQGITYTTPILYNQNNSCVNKLLKPNNNTSYMVAKFVRNVHTCSAGYYLPANIDECRKCLNDHYCPGGNLTFNETTPQGIIECPSNHPFAPAGMWQQSQCGRKLHVGDDILYMHQSPAHPTVHRLFIGHPNGIYSANAIQRDMNSNTFPKMSEGMSKGFHVTIDSVEYLICDDSVPECRNDQ